MAATLTIRLSVADRAFLRDLARVQLLSSDLADQFHYAHLKGKSSRPLHRLEQAGMLQSRLLRVTGAAPVRVFQFATAARARAFGGKLPVTGARRTEAHELLVSRLYFALGRPADFRVAANFSKADADTCGSMRPDALFTDIASGETVVVEADAGHYSTQQIHQKIVRWMNLGLHRQVWGQPQSVRARVPEQTGIQVLRF
jgi:hypothetical protein